MDSEILGSYEGISLTLSSGEKSMESNQGWENIESPSQFDQRVGLNFNNLALLTRALTHRSFINENPEALEDNERLEFLGDAVLDFMVGAWLYHRFPEMSEGDLTLMRTALVRTEQLADFARMIDLGSAMRLGQGEVSSGGRTRDALLCGGFEALIGSYYLDQGIKSVERFFEPFLDRVITEIMENGQPRDPKSLLQEWTQARGLKAPKYETTSEKGPDHAKVFEVKVHVPGKVTGHGKGNSKREASKLAAQAALDKIYADNRNSLQDS
jgi:ribonuclease-3